MRDAALLCYGFAGLGLMGGSLAQAIREKVLTKGTGRIFAVDRNSWTLAGAIDAGVIDTGFQPEESRRMLEQCDVVFVCLYPKQTIEFLKKERMFFKKGSLVTDISGVKGTLDTHLDAILTGDFDFVSTHPMAGSEKEGFTHASAQIFANRNYIIVPHPKNKPENIAFLKNLMTAVGFTRMIETDAETHDAKIAFTSQLCHIIASVLVDSAEDTNITSFGGGSFEDLTRIAMINAPLWTELFLSNREKLLDRIDSFEKSLCRVKKMVEEADYASLCRLLEDIRAKRIEMGRKDKR
ncbi:MAG: prephenate dehydrogenase [Spirochaetaceae bacterium]|jgi:prephenate dehydrogenase|nr:prephenate dehydrogenase [Spirochaetaceae bacterium]